MKRGGPDDSARARPRGEARKRTHPFFLTFAGLTAAAMALWASGWMAAPTTTAALTSAVILLLLVLGTAASMYAIRSRRELALVLDGEKVLEDLQKAQRILRLRNACNLALVRAADEAELLRGVCDAAVGEGAYPLAWIGYVGREGAPPFTVMAAAGEGAERLLESGASWSLADTGNGPVGLALRTGEPQVWSELDTQGCGEPWREVVAFGTSASCCAIPLGQGDTTSGVLMLFARDAEGFDDEEVDLLSDLGADVSFGIQAKRDAAALEEHQAELTLFRRAMDGSADAFFVADAETGRFVDFNESAARQLGYSRDELLHMSPPDIAPHLRDRDTWEEVLEATRRGTAGVRRSGHVRKDGSEFPVEISFSVVNHRGRTLILAISRDVSARDTAERESEALRIQLEQAQKMESVGRLAGGIAHDFNNLLTVVNATADLVLADLEADAPLREELEEIRAAGERAARLTRQLLAFSRRQVLRPRHVQVNDVIGDFLDMIRRVIGAHIVLEAALADDLPLIEGDAGQLEQVVMNLCVNARDAMPRGGTLTIATRKVILTEDDASRHVAMSAGEHVLLSVSDTGEGMDEATQARIFEPFFTPKARGKGTGLGLSTAYGIVKQSGGTIWAYSEVGLGTTFKVYFPAAQGPASVDPDDLVAPPGTETILLVEDEEPIRRLVRRILDRAGYSVLEAENGGQALEILDRSEGRVDLVLTDLVLPGMSGTQLAARLATAHPRVRILLATGYSAEALASRLPQDRHWSIIGKPYAVDELLHVVRRTLDR